MWGEKYADGLSPCGWVESMTITWYLSFHVSNLYHVILLHFMWLISTLLRLWVKASQYHFYLFCFLTWNFYSLCRIWILLDLFFKYWIIYVKELFQINQNFSSSFHKSFIHSPNSIKHNIYNKCKTTENKIE
jgi:hypothetical protein